MEVRPNDPFVPEPSTKDVGGAARRARGSLERQLRVEAERLEQEVETFYRATEKRAAALAEEKVADAAMRVGTELCDRLAADADTLRDELGGELSGALDRLDENGSRMLETVRGSLEHSSRERLAEQDAEARRRFEALGRTIGERIALAEAMLRERVSKAVSDARRSVGEDMNRRLKEESRRLREALAEPREESDGLTAASAEAVREEARERAKKFRAEVKHHLKGALESAEERLRADVAGALVAARKEVAADAVSRGAVADRFESARPELEQSIVEAVERGVSEQFERLAAQLWARSTARLDRHAKATTQVAIERATESASEGLDGARRQLRCELDAAISERIESLAAELRTEIGASHAELESRLAEASEETSNDLDARITSWTEEVRERADAAEKRLVAKLEAARDAGELAVSEGGRAAESIRTEVEEAGARALARLEEYVEVELAPKARRHDLRLARGERERRIAATEAQVDARGEEMLRIIRADLDRIRAESAAELRLLLDGRISELEVAVADVESVAKRAVEDALGGVEAVFDAEADALRRGLEGELGRMLDVAQAELGAGATTAILTAEREARERIEGSARRAADELETAKLRARTETETALTDAISSIRGAARDALGVRRGQSGASAPDARTAGLLNGSDAAKSRIREAGGRADGTVSEPG